MVPSACSFLHAASEVILYLLYRLVDTLQPPPHACSANYGQRTSGSSLCFSSSCLQCKEWSEDIGIISALASRCAISLKSPATIRMVAAALLCLKSSCSSPITDLMTNMTVWSPCAGWVGTVTSAGAGKPLLPQFCGESHHARSRTASAEDFSAASAAHNAAFASGTHCPESDVSPTMSHRKHCWTYRRLYVHSDAEQQPCIHCDHMKQAGSASHPLSATSKPCTSLGLGSSGRCLCCRECGYTVDSPCHSTAISRPQRPCSHDAQLSSPPSPSSPLKQFQNSLFLHTHPDAPSADMASEGQDSDTMHAVPHHSWPERAHFRPQPAESSWKQQDTGFTTAGSSVSTLQQSIGTRGFQAFDIQHAQQPLGTSPLTVLESGCKASRAESPTTRSGTIRTAVQPIQPLSGAGSSLAPVTASLSAVASSLQTAAKEQQSPLISSSQLTAEVAMQPETAGVSTWPAVKQPQSSQSDQLSSAPHSFSGTGARQTHLPFDEQSQSWPAVSAPFEAKEALRRHSLLSAALPTAVIQQHPGVQRVVSFPTTLSPAQLQMQQIHTDTLDRMPVLTSTSAECLHSQDSLQLDSCLDMPEEVNELLASLVASPAATTSVQATASDEDQLSTRRAVVSTKSCHSGKTCGQACKDRRNCHSQQELGKLPASVALAASCTAGSAAPAKPATTLSAGSDSPSKHRSIGCDPSEPAVLSHSSRLFAAGHVCNRVPDITSRRSAMPFSSAADSSVGVQTHTGHSKMSVADITSPVSQPQSVCRIVPPKSPSSILGSNVIATQQQWLAKQRRHEVSDSMVQRQQIDCSCSDSEGSVSSEHNLRPSSATRCQHGCLQSVPGRQEVCLLCLQALVWFLCPMRAVLHLECLQCVQHGAIHNVTMLPPHDPAPFVKLASALQCLESRGLRRMFAVAFYNCKWCQ